MYVYSQSVNEYIHQVSQLSYQNHNSDVCNLQDGNTLLHLVSGKGNYEAMKIFLKLVQLPQMDIRNRVMNTDRDSPREIPHSL